MPRCEDVTLEAGTLKRIHVNQFVIKAFHKTGDDQPAWIVRTSNGVFYCRHWTARPPSTSAVAVARCSTGTRTRSTTSSSRTTATRPVIEGA